MFFIFWKSFLRGVVTDCQHRAAGHAYHLFCRRAEKKMRHPSPAVGAHDQQVHIQFPGDPDNLLVGRKPPLDVLEHLQVVAAVILDLALDLPVGMAMELFGIVFSMFFHPGKNFFRFDLSLAEKADHVQQVEFRLVLTGQHGRITQGFLGGFTEIGCIKNFVQFDHPTAPEGEVSPADNTIMRRR